jgi:DNA polymerase-3 subunit gamma/tau
VSKALYRKYRSKSLDEVIGQRHITDILSRAISQGHVSHAYLLTGPRGVGKTSVARILAYAINDLPYEEDSTNLDIIEIDAASNNGVEDVRDLREKVQVAPFHASKKVYIIDEVHMLSKAAFNALLKTLEEPPEHVIFILATTNIEKLPATIISRTQRFSFRPIGVEDAVEHLANIAKKEGIKIETDALKLIAQRSDGSFRDSISLLDQLSSLVNTDKDKITVKLIEDVLGLAPNESIDQILNAVEDKDLNTLVAILDRVFDEGVDGAVLISQLTNSIRQKIAEKPNLLPLLDALIDVTKSPQPRLKLLSVLGMAAVPKTPPKTLALAMPVREVSATIKELEEQAVVDFPTETDIASVDTTTLSDPLEPESEKAPVPVEDPSRSRASKDSVSATSKKASISKSLDWSKLIEFTRKNYIALFSVLSKCGYQLDGDTLTLYTSNKFYKNKLDDSKYTALLSQCLQETGVFGLNVHTIPTTLPPKDSKAAAVAVIMGGGEEVSVESV